MKGKRVEPTFAGRLIVWGIAALAIVANVLGYQARLYDQWWWFDRVLHGATLFALTLWLGVIFFSTELQPEYARGLRTFLLLLGFGIAIGALWEVAEWGLENYTVANLIKGKNDTILDIIMDSFGAAAAAALTPFLLQSVTKRSGRVL